MKEWSGGFLRRREFSTRGFAEPPWLVKECGSAGGEIQDGLRRRSPRRLDESFFICAMRVDAYAGDMAIGTTGEAQQMRDGAAYLIVCAALLIVLILVVGTIRIDNPASHRSRALLRLDAALGATVEPLDPATARRLGGGSRADEMVVTSVGVNGRAAAAGLRVGDVVEQVDGQNPADLDAAVGAVSTDPTQVMVNRRGSHVILRIAAPPPSSRK
jgi:PDZ domain